MNDPKPQSPRQRLQQLLSVPERQRTDEQWDEIIELEISLAPGNREGAPTPGQPRQHRPGGGGNNPNQGQHQKPGGGHPGKKQRRFHKRPKPGGGGGNGNA